ncbi:hypothetical protein QR685DRAFT_360821 [Neurospora intermedia]|uniref:Secreted protein n=1 Tax=Neurospora intermedia TaxID=5142 RepID=A0ABR3D5B3_NEUIN
MQYVQCHLGAPVAVLFFCFFSFPFFRCRRCPWSESGERFKWPTPSSYRVTFLGSAWLVAKFPFLRAHPPFEVARLVRRFLQD